MHVPRCPYDVIHRWTSGLFIYFSYTEHYCHGHSNAKVSSTFGSQLKHSDMRFLDRSNSTFNFLGSSGHTAAIFTVLPAQYQGSSSPATSPAPEFLLPSVYECELSHLCDSIAGFYWQLIDVHYYWTSLIYLLIIYTILKVLFILKFQWFGSDFRVDS